MHKLALIALIALIALAFATAAQAQDFDEKPLRELSKKFAASWNKGDGAAIAALYAPDAVLTNPSGSTSRGRPAIQQGFTNELRQMAGSRIAFSAEEFRPLGADAAVWRCEWTLTGLKDGGSAKGNGLAVVQKTGDDWLMVEDLAAMTPAAPSAPAKKDAHGHGHGAGDHGHDH